MRRNPGHWKQGVRLAVLCLWLCACVAPASPPPTPAGGATLVPPAPIATADALAAWPGVQSLLPAGATIVNASEADTDDDGVNELLLIYQDQGIGRGLVVRHDAAQPPYALGGSQPAELFREKWTANTVRDVNADGKTEVVVQGVSGGSAQALNVFQWNGSAYVTLLSLTGAEGIAVDDAQNNGVLDFTALETLFRRSAIIHTIHAEWSQTAYRQSSEVLFLLGSPIDFTHPEETALAYYWYWNNGQPDSMLSLLAEPQKSRTPASALADQVRTTNNVRVETLSLYAESAASATVSAGIRYVDRGTGKEQAVQQMWRLVSANNAWQLAERLDANP